MDSALLESIRRDADYQTPGTSKGLLDVFRNRYLLSLLMKKGVATRYYGSVLGWVWSYIRPGAQFLMYYIVIGVIMGVDRHLDAFPIYLFTGIVAINLFSETLRNATNAITDNRALVRKIYLPRELFPVAACGVALVHFGPQALLLLIVSIIVGWTLGWMQVVALLVGVLLLMGFALGLGLFFGAANALYRDSKNIVDLILMFATWASPVLYPWTMVHERAPEWIFNVYMSNPVTVAVEMFHIAFWLPLDSDANRPDLVPYLIAASIITVVTLFIGQLVFRKLEGQFAQRL